MSTVLSITGMHRSGTSLTASWLSKCGLPIDNGNLIEAGVGNPKGHFEDKDFVMFHNSVIRAKNSKSLGWKVRGKIFFMFTEKQRKKAENLIVNRNTKYDIWGWKDPRTVIFLEEYKQLIPELKVLCIWRDFKGTVQSLIERSRKANQPVYKINLWQASALWVYYSQLVNNYKKKYPDDTIVIPLNAIKNNDQQVFALITEKLKIPLQYTPLSEVYEQNLLQQRQQSGTDSILLNMMSWGFGTEKLEESLVNISDLK